MKKIFILLIILGITNSNLFAQESKVLFTINNKPFYEDEFIRVYNKNLDLVKDDSQKNLDNYLDLYIGYKLKVEKALQEKLHENQRYINELKAHRTQLAKSYMNDSKVTQKLIEEAYNRIKTEVKASHILVLVDENASAEDTLKAYNKIKDLRARITLGEDFEKVALEFSEDPSVKDNKGNLGYFSAFRMVYPFENAAYTTPVGSISNPFRTKFGYHILKVTDSRENAGEVTVAHIMIQKPQIPDAQLHEKAKNTINDIYKKLEQGENFEELAKQFSEDKSTASKGGVLQRFGSGQLSSEEFEKQSFMLTKPNEISKPFLSEFGWHIVKLIEKHPIKSLEDMKLDLENRIKRDDRSLIITNTLSKKLREKYSIEKNNAVLKQVAASVTEDFYAQTWEIPTNNTLREQNILTINKDKKVGTFVFYNFLYNQQKTKLKTKSIQKLVNDVYEKFIDEQLTIYYNENLENEFKEFKYVVDEYKDGLLLFDLMEKEIWQRSKTDTLGIKDYYDANKEQYVWKKRYDIDIFSSTDKKIIEKASKYIKSNKSNDYIKEYFNKNNKVNIMVKSGLYEEDYDVLPKFIISKTGVAQNIVNKDGYYYVARIKEIKPQQTKLLEECKGKVVSDYADYLEKNWIDNLKKEFKISINNDVFNKVKQQLSN